MPTITLPVRCDRAAALALLPEFRAAQGSDDLTVDGTGAQAVGHAVLQLLASAHASFGGLTILASPALRYAANLAGGPHLLGESEA